MGEVWVARLINQAETIYRLNNEWVRIPAFPHYSAVVNGDKGDSSPSLGVQSDRAVGLLQTHTARNSGMNGIFRAYVIAAVRTAYLLVEAGRGVAGEAELLHGHPAGTDNSM